MPCANLRHHHHKTIEVNTLARKQNKGKYQVDIYNNRNSLLTYSAVCLTERLTRVLKNMNKSTYDIEVRGVCSPWVSPDPRGASSLHVDDGGTQAVDVCLGVVASTQYQLWTHVHLNDRTGLTFNAAAGNNPRTE